MSRPISWYRLFRGKVWHVGFAQDVAACGSERPADAETVGERAPANARVCADCVAASLHLYSLAQSAQMGDPRRTDDVIDAVIVCDRCYHPEHVGPCPEACLCWADIESSSHG